MSRRTSTWRVLWAATIVIGFVFGGPVAVAQQAPSPDPQQPRIDRSDGEQEQIDRRLEWFYSGRREGTTSDADMWRLRLDGVKQTRREMALQELRRQAGALKRTRSLLPDTRAKRGGALRRTARC